MSMKELDTSDMLQQSIGVKACATVLKTMGHYKSNLEFSLWVSMFIAPLFVSVICPLPFVLCLPLLFFCLLCILPFFTFVLVLVLVLVLCLSPCLFVFGFLVPLPLLDCRKLVNGPVAS